MRVLVVDDEPAMLFAMQRLLSKIEDIELVGSFHSAAEALSFVGEREADIAFLDIMLAADDGLELARGLRAMRPDLDIVFTTSRADFAMEAYDVYPLDYMVKPISRARLLQTITRAANRRKAAAEAAVEAVAEPAVPTLTVRGLGCFEASGGQSGAVKWMSKKSMELFAYLLVNQGRSVTKFRILEDIFPDKPVKNAELYLNMAVYQLRKALSLHGLKEMVVSAQEHYRVDLERAAVDFIQFEQGFEALSEIDETNEAAALELEKRFAGDLFGDKAFGWASAERERLALVYDDVAMRLARWLSDQERYRDALQIARRILFRNEYEEEANLLLLNILGAMGDRQALHSHYESYTQLLHREFGLPASEKFRAVYEQYR